MASKRFEENIYMNPRQTKAELLYALVAPEAKEIGVVTLPSGNPFSRPNQVINEITDISARVATFEPDHWRLDGSFVLPLPPEQSNMEVGWWGAKMSDENGMFENVPVIEIVFPIVQNIERFGIAFDEPSDNCISDLEITVYNSTGGVVLNERIDNTSAYAHTSEGALNAYRVVYKLYKTNNPFRYPRVSELDFGIIIKLTNTDIISLNLVTEANPTGASFPLPQLNLSINNLGRFDILDPKSYAQYLYARQAFQYRHGLVMPDTSVEWEFMGAYYLQDRSISDNTVSFTLGGKSSTLEKRTFFDSALQEFTVDALIRRVLDNVGMQYYIDPILDSSPVVTGWFGQKNYREVLANLIELSCCLGYENQQNTIEFTDINKTLIPVTTMEYKDIRTQPTTKLETYYNGINLTEYTVRQTEPEVQFDTEEIFYPAPWRDPLEPDYPYVVNLPCMVVTPNFPVFRTWFLNRKFALLRKRLSCDIAWRQNPALNVGQAAAVQLNNTGGILDMAIVKQTINFGAGGLSGNTKTVGDSPL